MLFERNGSNVSTWAYNLPGSLEKLVLTLFPWVGTDTDIEIMANGALSQGWLAPQLRGRSETIIACQSSCAGDQCINCFLNHSGESIAEISRTYTPNTRGNCLQDSPAGFCDAFRCLVRAKKEGHLSQLREVHVQQQYEQQCREAYDHVQYPFSCAGIMLRHDHPSGGGHMDAQCADDEDCKLVVEQFLSESGWPGN